jgi:1,4-dihydroxy-2-naphthoate octaprenyltransferase
MNRNALVKSLVIATALQLAMVLAGHWIAFIKDNLFAALGTAISILGAVHYARAARPPMAWAALGGAIVGALSGLVGILVSYVLKDVPVEVLWIGTGAGAVGGAVAGTVARLVFKPQ